MVDFEKLYRMYFMDIYSYLMTMVKNPSLAEELTQECFFRAMKSKEMYKGKSSERTWLCSIAKNLCIDEMRRQKKFSDEEKEMVSRKTPEQDVVTKMSTLQIHKILHQMEEPYKEVFELRTFGELSFADIGQIFEKTESWARVTYHRARIKLIERTCDYE